MLVDAHNGVAEGSGFKTMEPAERWLLTLRKMGTPEARDELMKFMGVGRKVADCVMLMSLDKVRFSTAFNKELLIADSCLSREKWCRWIPMSTRLQ